MHLQQLSTYHTIVSILTNQFVIFKNGYIHFIFYIFKIFLGCFCIFSTIFHSFSFIAHVFTKEKMLLLLFCSFCVFMKFSFSSTSFINVNLYLLNILSLYQNPLHHYFQKPDHSLSLASNTHTLNNFWIREVTPWQNSCLVCKRLS